MRVLILTLLVFIANSSWCADQSILVDTYIIKAGWKNVDQGYMDPVTSLIWSRESGDLSWGEAKVFCSSLKDGNKNDWRLPTVNELQASVCNISGYDTRIACLNPRDHEKDLWILNKNTKKEVTYWASNLIPGDPYNAYYFKLDVEGQHVITSKNDKANARCVRDNKTKVINSTNNITEEIDDKNLKPFVFISPMIGIGSYVANDIMSERYFFMSGSLKLGINTRFDKNNRLFITGDAEFGFDIQNFEEPLVFSLTFGPEYFVHPKISVFAGVGLGLIYKNVYIPQTTTSSVVSDTFTGLGWKFSANWFAISWGEKSEYMIPISLSYSGVRANWSTSHVIMVSLGFRFQSYAK